MLSGQQQPSTPRLDTRSLSPPAWCYDLTEDRCPGYYAGHPSHECHWDAQQHRCTSRRGDDWCGAGTDGQAMRCEYMRAPASNGQAGRCRMDGDHLDGRWVQTCQPSLITQPDVYAYGRPIARLPGKFDYRLCFRQSAHEMNRTQAALSWSWQPRACHFAPVEGQQFDSWLGRRTVLLLGDSILGQLFYSLVFLLGRAVAQVRQFSAKGDVREAAANASAQDVCESSAGSEGDHQAVEVTLQRGGRVLFLMSHFAIVHQMQHADSAPWAEYAREADFVMLNLGHHFRQIDPTFASYSSIVRATELSLSSVLKPHAHLAFLTTNLGHPNCGAATRPFDSPSTAWEQLVSSGSPYDWRAPDSSLAAAANLTGSRISFYSPSTGDAPDRFDWRAPPLHEGAWRHTFTRSEAFAHRFHVLNVSFVDARADGHVSTANPKPGAAGPDCLHYCYPGVADFWAASLYNLLLRL